MARTTKLNDELLQRIYEWVAEHGLYPEPNGATIKSFCAEFGIGINTHSLWLNNSDYCDTIKKANEIYRMGYVRNLERSLYDQAMGNYTQKKKRTRIINEDGKPQVKETIIDEITVAPNATATIFALKNADPSKWRDKQEHDVRHINPINIKVDEETKAILDEYFGMAGE